MDAQTRALEIFRQIGDRGNEAWALNSYAATIAARGDRPHAFALYQQALEMNRELRKPDDEAISLEGIADHHLATGDRAQGTVNLNEALEIYQRLGMHADIERILARLSLTRFPGLFGPTLVSRNGCREDAAASPVEGAVRAGTVSGGVPVLVEYSDTSLDLVDRRI